MSSHHEIHPSQEPKPVSFTVPFILACVTLLVVFLFMSLCDPGSHGHDEMENPAHAKFTPGTEHVSGHGSNAMEKGTVTTEDSAHVEAPAAEAPASDSHH
jgi:hypothetical protein